MYLWMFIAHMATPLGTVGFRDIPSETAVLTAMQGSMGTTSGLYMFPGMGLGPNPSAKQMHDALPAYEQKLKTTPSGIMVYHAAGRAPMTNTQLGIEFVTEIVEAVLAIFLLSLTRIRGFGRRVGFVMLVGLLGAMVTNVPYWNWYGFPGSYTIASIFTQVIGFAAAGLAGAAVLGREATRSMAAAA
jgi:hypothetical protein